MASTIVINHSSKGISVAKQLMQKHQQSLATASEDAPDGENLPINLLTLTSSTTRNDRVVPPGVSNTTSPMLTRIDDKQKVDVVSISDNQLLDTQSDELFPGLGAGAPKTKSAPVWGASKPTSDGQVSTIPYQLNNDGISSGVTPVSAARTLPPSLAGQIHAPLLVLQGKDLLPRNQLKKPIPDTLKDINRKLRTNLSMVTREGGILEFRDTSHQKEALKQQAIKDLGSLVGAKKSIKISIPRSVTAYIIGRQGTTVKALQESTGARIQLPKSDDSAPQVQEDEDMVDVTVEGNSVAIQLAQKEIERIVNERSANVLTRLRNIPAEFYPFIAGPDDKTVDALESAHQVQIHIPSYSVWNSTPPPQKPSPGQFPDFSPASGDELITISGDRPNVQAAHAAIERLAQKLHQEITIEQFMVNNSQHQFVIGKQGISPQSFFSKTGCAIILPGDANEDTITIVGHSEHIENAVDYAIDLASSMNQTILDVSRLYRNFPGSARIHARNITMYLVDRNEIERICDRFQIYITTPMDAEGVAPWEIFYRSENNRLATKAQTEIGNIISAYPPSRLVTINTDPFFHNYLQREIMPKVKKDYHVRMVIPEKNMNCKDILLVYEGGTEDDLQYQISREKPDVEFIKLYEKSLADARQFILSILSKQAEITETTIEVPRIFHDKMRRFIQGEQKNRTAQEIPVRVFVSGTKLTMRGPEPSVISLSAKVDSFLSQAIEEEKERDFTLSFNFPPKHVNQLIGKGGSNIRDMKHKFDVEISINDGTVEIKGPKVKSEIAKSHIISLGKQWADEVTYKLKIDPSFHRELIGAQGVQINRLQSRYKVQIHFPRSAKPVTDELLNIDSISEVAQRSLRREQEPDEVIVKGPKKGADEARDEILSLYQYLNDHSHIATVSVQAGQISSLIGQRGSGMEEVRQITSAKIDIPNAKDIKDPTTRVEIQIKGTKTSVALAKKLIEEKKNIFDNTVTKTLKIDKEHHGALIGAQGSILRDIIIKAGGSDDRRELARTVQFPKSDSMNNLIKIEGSKDVVDKIITALQEIVHDRENNVSDSIDIPIEKHRSLIGRNGEIRKELENIFKVSIEIPRQGSSLTEVKISGLPPNVDKAKARIREIISEREEEIIQIPRSLHHAVSDNGQIFRRLRNDYQITVDHGGQKAPAKPVPIMSGKLNGTPLPLITDDSTQVKDAYMFSTVDTLDPNIDGHIPWILRGSSEKLAEAKAYVSNALELALKINTHGYLVLPDPRTYRYVIGQGGSKVQAIRKETGCKIIVPREHGSEEAIEIIGSSEGVEKAKDMILMAVRDAVNAKDDYNPYSGRGRNEY